MNLKKKKQAFKNTDNIYLKKAQFQCNNPWENVFNNRILKEYFSFKGSRFVITCKYQKYGIIYSNFVF